MRLTGLGSVVIACGVLVIAGCSSSGSKSVAAGVTSTTGATSTSAATVLLASNGVLTDANGMTLYTFSSDTAGATTSACTGACAHAWPALTANGAATAGQGVTGTLTTISGGQVSWNGHPLYRWIGDKKPGDTTGDGINGFQIAKVTASSGTGPTTTAAPASGY